MHRRTSVAIGALAVACGIDLIIAVVVTLDVIRKHGEGWGVAAFCLATGGAFAAYLIIIVRAQIARNAALAARDRAEALPQEPDE